MEVEMTIRGLLMDPVTNMPIVILKDVAGRLVLPIWVGVYEAQCDCAGDGKSDHAASDDA